ncbi:uncharacterized protein AB675_4690 [Cyphellophora attinorum]|uniref:Helicase ATP-binding domain-containing protein n=1 Tax=Cyphellophora attinorum TaxID=1664694 RepID=A0A0N1H2T7_9EURO|nr:uncharacterized protein AB675_4690 [Phialophora attinorum]KPI39093.1 hypothetical protein AB675_4690 [Phialophora attinorum]
MADFTSGGLLVARSDEPSANNVATTLDTIPQEIIDNVWKQYFLGLKVTGRPLYHSSQIATPPSRVGLDCLWTINHKQSTTAKAAMLKHATMVLKNPKHVAYLLCNHEKDLSTMSYVKIDSWEDWEHTPFTLMDDFFRACSQLQHLHIRTESCYPRQELHPAVIASEADFVKETEDGEPWVLEIIDDGLSGALYDMSFHKKAYGWACDIIAGKAFAGQTAPPSVLIEVTLRFGTSNQDVDVIDREYQLPKLVYHSKTKVLDGVLLNRQVSLPQIIREHKVARGGRGRLCDKKSVDSILRHTFESVYERLGPLARVRFAMREDKAYSGRADQSLEAEMFLLLVHIGEFDMPRLRDCWRTGEFDMDNPLCRRTIEWLEGRLTPIPLRLRSFEQAMDLVSDITDGDVVGSRHFMLKHAWELHNNGNGVEFTNFRDLYTFIMPTDPNQNKDNWILAQCFDQIYRPFKDWKLRDVIRERFGIRRDVFQRRHAATAVAIAHDVPPPSLPASVGKPLPQPSAEQQVAIDTLLNTKSNIIVDAMAGSGKTTTILHLAQAAPDTKFLVLVYNRKLLLETDERAKSLGLSNVAVYNYHTLGNRFYTQECSTDQGLKRVVQDDMAVLPGTQLPDFDVLIMDEQQDLIPIYKKFVDKIVSDKGYVARGTQQTPKQSPLRVFVLGDKRQQIYSFNNADSRFLTMANERDIFGYVNQEPWVRAQQTYSNRMTEPNADFINDQLLRVDLGASPMRAARSIDRDGKLYPRPRYIICDPAEEAVSEVQRLLTEGNVKPADILVLAPSTRNKSAAKQAANELARRDVPVYRADSDVLLPSDRVTHGKVLICTYHQSKGIERPVCIALGFDQSYHSFYDKQDELPAVVTNPQYVAATRAVTQLILLQDFQWAPLPYVNLSTIGETCDLIVRKAPIPSPQTVEAVAKARKLPLFGVTALCRNLPETVITHCLEKLKLHQVAAPVYPASAPPTEVADKYGLIESTAAITGTAVPALFEWFRTRDLTILNQLFYKDKERGPLKWIEKNLPPEHVQKFIEIHEKCQSSQELSSGDILYVAHVTMAKLDNDLVGLLSIPLSSYNWVTPEYIDHIMYTLGYIPKPANIGKRAKYEVTKIIKFMDIQVGPLEDDNHGVLVMGSMDIYQPKTESSTVWEVKHIDVLSPEHLIQTALYMLLLHPRQKPAHGYLVSARTGHVVEISPAHENALKELLQILVGVKSGGPQARLLHECSDEEFLAEAARDFSGLIGKCALPAWFSERPSRSRYQPKKTGRPRASEQIDV